MLGYFRPSLRDEEGQFLAALDIPVRNRAAAAPEADKNVRAPCLPLLPKTDDVKHSGAVCLPQSDQQALAGIIRENESAARHAVPGWRRLISRKHGGNASRRAKQLG